MFFFAALRCFVTLHFGGNSEVISRFESGDLVTDLLACGVWASASVCSGSVGSGDAGDGGNLAKLGFRKRLIWPGLR